ncbi:mitochondrial ribosome-associated GTPase 2-like [Gigantopelta aegis]|uniref:mitochondrial ribosome-associated GTPase 2-like n=1 Tax=Gigantopelta aegis TaxID=1735272 RepID=UPI001B8882CC|nr:mitochondrial ribosome-associated GTPase 2-like [Gigantopelta aegis]XP_041375709.1 mitochondrial ribosome-associated GTPase 2-like [Gigantopelta aegis]
MVSQPYRVVQQLLQVTCRCRCHYRCLSAKPIKPHKAKAKSKEPSKIFVDFKKVHVKGGHGGNGFVSFSSLPGNEWAGPDGGNGGNGGHIIFKASTNYKSLSHLDIVITGENGVPGQSKNCYGKSAQHTNIGVPVGTVVRDETGDTLTSLEEVGDYFVAARGGAGGKGNHFFLSNENRAPSYAETGAEGQDRILLVELRTMAHAGLIGFPNAGKSTLLRAISRARPKVAAYPFTTLNPHVGMVMYDDFEQIAVADIPGLISGAHKNRGLGISFLRHIERCACLLYVIDLSLDKPWTQFEDLRFELECYKAGLSQRPHAIIGNKIDLPVAKSNLSLLQKHVDLPVFPISAEKMIGLDPLLIHLRQMYDKYAEKKGTGW